MTGILMLESLTRGNTLKQGDKTPLKYRLFDADGENLNIAGKSAKVRLVYPDFLTIGYEKDGLTVAQDDTVTFTIDGVIPSRIYHVEIIVDGQFIFPSRSDESKFTVDKSSLGTEANIIEIVGVDAVVRKAVDLINEDPSLIIDEDKLVGDIISNTGIGSIEEYHQQFTDVLKELSKDKDYYSLPEIAGARRGYSTLAESLGNLSVNMLNPNLGKLTQIHMSDELLTQIAGDAAVNAVPADRSLTTPKYADDSVTVQKAQFIDKSKNLFNLNKAVDGFDLSTQTGELVENTAYTVSEFIPVVPFSTIYKNHYGAVIEYDSSFNLLVAYGTGHGARSYGLNRRTEYLRVSMLTDNKNSYQLEYGEEGTPYQEYGNKLSNEVEVSLNNFPQSEVINLTNLVKDDLTKGRSIALEHGAVEGTMVKTVNSIDRARPIETPFQMKAGDSFELIDTDTYELAIATSKSNGNYLNGWNSTRDRKSTRLNSSHHQVSRMPSSA